MSNEDYKDKFIAFVDILGFKNMIEVSESGAGRTTSEIKELLTELGRAKDKEFYKTYGPQICPESNRIQKNLDFQITQISDCAIASSEISPAGVINLVQHCWGAAIALLTKGVMVRGYITRGKIYHDESTLMGTGYQKAFEKEASVKAFKRDADDRGTPFIELASEVCDYVSDETDECVRKMFSRYVKNDGEVTAIFPFQVLAHSFPLAGFGVPTFSSQQQKQNNNRMRNNLRNFRQRILQYVDGSNLKAVSKATHYISALDDQLKICDDTDSIIDALDRPFPATTFERPTN